MAKGYVKTHTACALLGGALLAANAHAQSSVTLYGVIDEGIDYVNNSTWDGSGSITCSDPLRPTHLTRIAKE
jgi:predicted porin